MKKNAKLTSKSPDYIASDIAPATFRTPGLLEPKSSFQKIISDLSTSSSQSTKKTKARKLPIRLDLPEGRIEAEIELPLARMRLVDLASMVLDLSSTVADMGARISAKLGRRVSCSRGCGACCRQITPLSPPEAIMIAELVESLTGETRRRIQKRFTAATRQLERSGILAKLAPLQNPSSLSEKDMLALSRAYFRQQIPCPFLANESCSIYAFRPSRCREYLVSSPAKHCRDPYEQHIEQLPVSIRLSETLGRMWAEATQTPLQLVPLTLAPAWSAEQKPDRSIGADAHRMMDVLLFHVTKLAAEYERQNLSSLKGNG